MTFKGKEQNTMQHDLVDIILKINPKLDGNPARKLIGQSANCTKR